MFTFSPKNSDQANRNFEFQIKNEASTSLEDSNTRDLIFESDISLSNLKSKKNESVLLDTINVYLKEVAAILNPNEHAPKTSIFPMKVSDTNNVLHPGNLQQRNLQILQTKLSILHKDLLSLKEITLNHASNYQYSEEFIQMNNFKFGSQDDSFMTELSRIQKYVKYYIKYSDVQNVSAFHFVNECMYPKMFFEEDVEQYSAWADDAYDKKDMNSSPESMRFDLMVPIVVLKTIKAALRVVQEELKSVACQIITSTS